MEPYKLDEKYFEYHLRYYYSLLDVRRNIARNMDEMKKIYGSVTSNLDFINIEVPDLGVVNKISEECLQFDELFECIAKNVNRRWEKIGISEDPTKGSCFLEDPKYFINYWVPHVTDSSRVNVIRLEEELGIKSSKWYSGSDKFEKFWFDSIDELISKTKNYLLKFD